MEDEVTSSNYSIIEKNEIIGISNKGYRNYKVIQPKKFDIHFALNAFIEHRWEDAEKLLPFLLLHIECIPLELLFRFTSGTFSNRELLLELKTHLKSMFWYEPRGLFFYLITHICHEFPDLEAKDVSSFVEEIVLLSENPNANIRNNKHRYAHLAFGYMGVILYYHNGGHGFDNCPSSAARRYQLDENKDGEEAGFEKKSNNKGIKKALQKFSLALSLYNEEP